MFTLSVITFYENIKKWHCLKRLSGNAFHFTSKESSVFNEGIMSCANEYGGQTNVSPSCSNVLNKVVLDDG